MISKGKREVARQGQNSKGQIDTRTRGTTLQVEETPKEWEKVW